ncbi:MAG: hypothetical protein ACTHJ9_10320 [Rhodanobacter sp.]
MTSGVKSNNVDLDDLFDPDIVGDGPASAGVKSGGVPLKYAAIKYGTKRANVGILNAGSDVSNLWAAKGTASYALPINGQTFARKGQALTGQEGTITGTVQFTARADGTYAVTTSASPGSPSTPASGTWQTQGGAASDYQVQFTLSAGSTSGTGSTANTAPAYTSLATAQSASVTCTCPANDSGTYTWTYGLRIRIRRVSTGAVISDTTITMSASAAGMV